MQRAQRRAAILAAATGNPVKPVVIGVYAREECRQAANEHDVTVIILPEYKSLQADLNKSTPTSTPPSNRLSRTIAYSRNSASERPRYAGNPLSKNSTSRSRVKISILAASWRTISYCILLTGRVRKETIRPAALVCFICDEVVKATSALTPEKIEAARLRFGRVVIPIAAISMIASAAGTTARTTADIMQYNVYFGQHLPSARRTHKSRERCRRLRQRH